MSDVKNEPLFTVIIPTKDRADYLAYTLKSCSMQEYSNLEVIVSDDGSTDTTKEVVQHAASLDPRIRYVTPPASGMRENFEFALSQVRPGFVIALGGDDGLLPNGIRDMNNLLQLTGAESLAWPAPVYYYSNVKSRSAQLILHAKMGRPKAGHKMLSADQFLAKTAKNLSYVSDVESPMFYVKGVVSTRVIDSVKNKSADGRFYACATPDGFSGIVTAGEIDEYVFSETPFSIYGMSPTSYGFGYLSESDRAKQQSESFFKDAKSKPMHQELGSQPYSPLICLMTADYLLTARDLPGWCARTPDIDYKQLIRQSLNELADGNFAKARTARELDIISGVAEYRGLGEYFRQSLSKTKRNRRTHLDGNALSPSRLYLDGDKYSISNIVEAAYFAYYFHAFGSRVTAKSMFQMLVNSGRYFLQSYRKYEDLDSLKK